MPTEMPQIFQVLRCYKCLTFQVHQTKKSNKFSCKICDEKQSIKRHYGIGIAKDCRMHVQKLNTMRGEKHETKLEEVSDECEEANTPNSPEDTLDTIDNVKKSSKWLLYIDKKIEETDNDENEIVSETNHINKKRWSRNKKRQNYEAKKNIALKRRHYNVIHEDDLTDVIENITENDNTMNVFGKRPLFENEDDCSVEDKVRKPISHHDMKLQRNNSELKDNNQINTDTAPKLQTAKINKSSKWIQFIERDEDVGDEAVEKFSKNIQQPMFSLCDESDIDDVLDI